MHGYEYICRISGQGAELKVTLLQSLCLGGLQMKEINGTNWMGETDALTPLSQLNIPGTHDCGTKYVEKYPEKYRCQSLSVQEQMMIGVRYFDIRCNAGSKDKTQYIKHSMIACKNEQGNLLTIDELIETGKKFLQDFPTETLIFQVRNEGRGSNDARICNHLGKYIVNGSLWSQNRIPCLGEVRGKIVLVRRFTAEKNEYRLSAENYGINLSSWDSECSVKKGLHTFVHVNERAWVQDRYDVGVDEKFGLLERAIAEMNDTEKKPSAGWSICLSSCMFPTPFKAAETINGKLLSGSSPLNVKKTGTFVVDFATEELIRKIYMTNYS